MTYRLLERNCGSAPIATSLFGLADFPHLYASPLRRRARASILDALYDSGFGGRPSEVVLTDEGPWGRTWKALLDPRSREAVLSALSAAKAVEVYERLRTETVARRDEVFAFEFLLLQRLAFAGRAVREEAGFWRAERLYGDEVEARRSVAKLVEELRAVRWDGTSTWRVGEARDVSVAVLEGVPEEEARAYAKAGALVFYLGEARIEGLGWESFEIKDAQGFLSRNDRRGEEIPLSTLDVFGETEYA